MSDNKIVYLPVLLYAQFSHFSSVRKTGFQLVFPPVHKTRLKDRVSPQAYLPGHCLQQILMHLSAHAIWSLPDLACFLCF